MREFVTALFGFKIVLNRKNEDGSKTVIEWDIGLFWWAVLLITLAKVI